VFATQRLSYLIAPSPSLCTHAALLMFCRVHILEKRLKQHEEQALHKYYELDYKLRSDVRLAALLNL
jgi:hypothetical protein